MSRRFSDESIDVQLLGHLRDRAEDGAAQARTAEQVAADMAAALRPGFWGGGLGLRGMRLVGVIVLALLVLALLASIFGGSRSPSLIPTQIITIGIDLPLGGGNRDADSVANGIRLAVDDAGGRAGHFQIQIPPSAVLSDVRNGSTDIALGATNMRFLIADPEVVAVIGPFNSSVAYAQIPISNAAGLLQCSPAATDPQLTRPAGGQSPTTASPSSGRANFVRVVTTDDVAAVGAARFVFQRLGKTSVLVVDDSTGFGTQVAGWFQGEFARLGGTIVAGVSLPSTDAARSAMLVSARGKNPQAIYFAGGGAAGATLLTGARLAGLGGIPFVGTDALNDGPTTTPGSFLNLAGTGATQAFSVVPGHANGPAVVSYATRYRASFGAERGPFSVFGYACAQVVIAALHRIDAAPPSTVGLREEVRAAGIDPTATFETVIGPIAFDARGDVTDHVVTIDAPDAATGTWVSTDQIDAGPASGK